MIAVRPDTDAWRVLELLVDHPGELDAEAIGHWLWRPKIRIPADVLPVRAAIRDHEAEWSARASNLLHRLQSAKLVEKMRPPSLGPDIAPPTRTDPASLREYVGDVFTAAELDAAPAGTTARLLIALVREAPRTMRAWVGPAPTGSTQRALASLIEAKIVIPPTRRWPSPDGIALIEGKNAA